MSYELNSQEKRILREIARFYGCHIRFRDQPGGVFGGKYIEIGYKAPSLRSIVSVFCHELAHFVNWKTAKYPIYHNPRHFGNLPAHFTHYRSLVNYALKAELYTEDVGAELCKEWFPTIKYERTYFNNKECRAFLEGYYARG
jgi:hypothetical protein